MGYWGLPRSANIPPITEVQAEALDALHFTAEKYAVSLDFRQGTTTGTVTVRQMQSCEPLESQAGFLS
jgi:hypothetical protein